MFGALKTIKTSKKPETSILLKDYISDIYYSNETVYVKFIYPPIPPINQEETMGGGGHLERNSHKKATSKGNFATYEPYFNDLQSKSQEKPKDALYENTDHLSNEADRHEPRADHSEGKDKKKSKRRQTKKAGKPALHFTDEKVRSLNLIGSTKSLTHFFLMPFPNSISKR